MNQYNFIGTMAAQSRTIVNIDAYKDLFKVAGNDVKIGEASTLYLYDKETPQRIANYIPSVKLIAILRNPIDRAYSHFQHFRRDRHEPLASFSEAIDAEPERMKQNWFMSYFYTDAGFYSKQLKNYLNLFPRSQLKIFLYEDLQDTQQLVKEIFDYIGVNPDISLDTSAKFNISGNVRFPWLYQTIRKSSRVKPFIRKLIMNKNWNWLKNRWDSIIMKKYEPMSGETRQRLINIYREDILELQEILQRDLSSWLN